jgi:hypothetical protein
MKNLAFSFARVPATWNYMASSQSDFMSILNAIVAAADANDVMVEIDFHQILGWNAFPQDMINAYSASGGAEPGYDNMMVAWFQNKATHSWQDMVNNFWTPIIQAIDSHPSVVGYEIMNEPYAPSPITVAQEQAHNQFFANALRKLTSKAVIYMADCTSSLENQGNTIVSVAPTGISNLVLDVHRYSTNDPTSDFGSWYADAVEAKCAGVFVGEWGPGGSGSIDTTTEQNCINAYYAAFGKYGLGNSYWAWCAGSANDREALCDANWNPDWIATMLSKAIGATPPQPTTLTLKVTQV